VPLTCVKPPAVVPQREGCSNGLVIAPIPLHHLGACRQFSPGIQTRESSDLNGVVSGTWSLRSARCCTKAYTNGCLVSDRISSSPLAMMIPCWPSGSPRALLAGSTMRISVSGMGGPAAWQVRKG
jgi:hypothetical protein